MYIAYNRKSGGGARSTQKRHQQKRWVRRDLATQHQKSNENKSNPIEKWSHAHEAKSR